MYVEHFQLQEAPFRQEFKHDFIYYSRSHEECLTRLLYTVNERKGAVLLTGMHGSGKSLLLDVFESELRTNGYQVARIGNANLPPEQFLEELLYQLGVSSKGKSKVELLRDVREVLRSAHTEDREIVVIVDEVQFVTDSATFLEMHQLLNITFEGRCPLTLVLAGEPDAQFRLDEMASLSDRLAMRARLEVLNHEDTAHYLQHRLTVAGCQRPLFTAGAIEVMYRATHGVPRRLNHLADTCLLVAAGEGQAQVDERIAREAVAEWQGRA